MREEFKVRVHIERQWPGGTPLSIGYSIDRLQVEEMAIQHHVPHPFTNSMGFRDWTLQRERAEALAKHLGLEIANLIVKAANT